MYLSPKKQNFVNFIQGFTIKNGRPPTFVEIMGGLDIKSLGTIHWYVTELEKEGVIKRTKNPQGKRALSILERNLRITLPLLGIVQAGYPLEVFDTSENIEVPQNFIDENNFALQVRGDSMIEDQIKDGDFIIVKKTSIAKNGDLIIAYVNNNATLKRFYKKQHHIELKPSNSNFEIIQVSPQDEFRIGGKLLCVLRKF